MLNPPCYKKGPTSLNRRNDCNPPCYTEGPTSLNRTNDCNFLMNAIYAAPSSAHSEISLLRSRDATFPSIIPSSLPYSPGSIPISYFWFFLSITKILLFLTLTWVVGSLNWGDELFRLVRFRSCIDALKRLAEPPYVWRRPFAGILERHWTTPFITTARPHASGL